MKVKLITIIIDTFETVAKGLVTKLEELEIGERDETFQTAALLSSARILGRILKNWGDLLSLRPVRNY